MSKVKIGLGRFYNANFCELGLSESIVWEQQLKDIEVICSLNKDTRHSLHAPITFNISDKKGLTTDKPILYPSQDKFPANLYFEVTAYRWIEVDDDLGARLFRKDLKAREEVYKQFKLYNDDLQQAVDYTAGMLGLRINPELVTIPILEIDQKYIFINDDTYSIQSEFGLEIRQSIKIEHSKAERIKLDSSSLKNHRGMEKTSECMAWLLRGWSAKDYVLRFMSFFTALEPVIPPPQKSDIENFETTKAKLLELVQHQNENKEEIILSSFLNNLSPYTPITKRFEKWAGEARLENWETDIIEFKRFNRMRNFLLHRGDTSIAKEPFVTNDDLRGLEYLSQKYISWALYGKRNIKPLNKIGKTIISTTMNYISDFRNL